MKILTNNLELACAKAFRDSVANGDNLYYVFAGRHLPWSDESQPDPNTNDLHNVEYNSYDNMIFGKRVNGQNTVLMVARKDWIYNTVYTRFDDTDPNLDTKDYYVSVESTGSRHVFICLDNNNDSPSLYAPSFEDTSPAESFYFTADGYQWKYLFSVDNTTFNKYASGTYMPFVENVDVTGNAVHGAIETIVIDKNGSNYNSYSNGFFQEISINGNNVIHTIEPTSSANTDFYQGSALKIVQGPGAGQQRTISEYVVAGGQKRVVLDRAFVITPTLSSRYEISPRVDIRGDGFDCDARAIINPIGNTISHIEISNTGFGYSYADASVVGNTGFLSGSASTDPAKLRVIFGPPGGFGADVPRTLMCDTAAVSVTISNTELGTIPAENKFRTIGLIKDPRFANVELILTDIEGTFTDGEKVSSANTSGIVTFYNEASALLRLTNVDGKISANAAIKGNSSNATAVVTSVRINGFDKTFDTYDQRMRFNITMNSPVEFVENERVTQHQTFANGYVEGANTTFMGITNARGTFNTADITDDFTLTAPSGASANINAIIQPDLVKNTGQILYLENVQPVERSPSTSETIKIILSFNTK